MKRIPHYNEKEQYYDVKKAYLGDIENDGEAWINTYVAYQKLGELEDIEEELGIDLIKILKAEKIYFFDYCYDRIIDSNYYIIDVKLKQLQVENDYGDYINLDFSDYGKTWALTKEELENERK